MLTYVKSLNMCMKQKCARASLQSEQNQQTVDRKVKVTHEHLLVCEHLCLMCICVSVWQKELINNHACSFHPQVAASHKHSSALSVCCLSATHTLVVSVLHGRQQAGIEQQRPAHSSRWALSSCKEQ